MPRPDNLNPSMRPISTPVGGGGGGGGMQERLWKFKGAARVLPGDSSGPRDPSCCNPAAPDPMTPQKSPPAPAHARRAAVPNGSLPDESVARPRSSATGPAPSPAPTACHARSPESLQFARKISEKSLKIPENLGKILKNSYEFSSGLGLLILWSGILSPVTLHPCLLRIFFEK